MKPKRNTDAFYNRILRRTGGYYILFSIVAVQLVTYLVVGPVSALIQNNAQMNPSQLTAAVIASLALAVFTNLVMLGMAYRLSRNAFRRLQNWAKGVKTAETPEQEGAAWREITNLPWRIGLLGSIASFLLVIGPLMFFEYQSLGLTLDQLGYTLLGGFMAALTIVTINALGTERLLRAAREVLVPSEFDAQASGVIGLNILQKLQILMLALIVGGIVIVAPIGYHGIVEVTQGLEAQTALREYQIQSLLVSAMVILLGVGLTTMMARALSDPFRDLVDIFRNVEQGSLSQRARIIATDEAGELEIHFNRMIARLEALQTSLERQVAERTAQLEAVNEVGRAASAILDPDKLIEKVVNLITDRFGHYYSALFIADPAGKWAELRSATGEAGRVLRESHHRLEIGGKSMVGSAIALKQARIALDVGAESVRFDNPILPYTHSEIALPLIVGERVLGALDVQSTKQSAFGPQDVETLQNMANQVAIALENAHLFQETNERLQEVQSVQRQYLREAWTSQATRENLEYGVGDETVSENETALDVPLALRDQIIGQIKLTGEAEWSPEERAWVESVATQAAVALENARLMEESREQATLERTVAEITTKIWSASTMDGILQTAVKEIGRALNLSEATIELRTEEEGESR